MDKGGAYGFLYENRDRCHTIAMIQAFIIVFTVFFTSTVWWCSLFGLIVACMGYYGSAEPVIQSKVSYVQFYYFGSCFMLILQLFSLLVWVILTSEASKTKWVYFHILFGGLAFILQLCTTYMAVERSYAYRAELMRNPPPAENIYVNNATSGAYTALGTGYKSPGPLKTAV